MTTPLKRKAADVAGSSGKKIKGNASITSFFSSPSAPTQPASQVAAASTSAPSSSPSTVKDETSPQESQSQSQASTKAPASSTPPATASIFNKKADAAAAASAPSTSSSSVPGTKFDKQKWIDNLSAEQKDLLALEIEHLHESWLGPLKDEVTSSSFLDLKRFLKREHEAGEQIFPPAADVYSW